MVDDTFETSRDWLRNPRTIILAWCVPLSAIFAGLFASVPVRTVVWIVALAWMGTACVLNARRCRRTHCRYTGPYYFLMIAPVVLLGSGIVSIGIYAWLILALIILLGSATLWRVTEQAWGKFS